MQRFTLERDLNKQANYHVVAFSARF